MNQRGGGCCIAARYAGAGNGASAYGMSKVERVMLKFRPIAPKPVNNDGNNSSGGGSGGSGVSPVTLRRSTRGRRKRATKLNSDCSGRSGVAGSKRKRKTTSPPSPATYSPENGGRKPTVKTLSFIPEKPDVLSTRRNSSSSSPSPSSSPTSTSSSSPLWLSFNGGGGGGSVLPSALRAAVASWVKVERVTDTWTTTHWADSAGAAFPLQRRLTDVERVALLDRDTCPAFVTDGGGSVVWVNDAYKKMVSGGAGDYASVVAWVAMEEGVVVPSGCVGFTCRVRVVTCGGGGGGNNNNNISNKTAPCDVWKMDGGGFAWRLDTTAALSLWVGSSC